MRNFKVIVMSTLLALSFVPVVYAADAPTACPTVPLIKKASLSGVQEDKQDSLYVAYQISKYTTPSTWAFVIAIPFDQATTRGDAMNKAKAALLTLTGEPEPLPTTAENKQWYCLYQNDYDYLAAAVTPLSVSENMTHEMLKFKKSL